LAGIAACLEACKTPYLLTVPCDSPLIAPDLAPRLFLGLNDQGADMAVASDGLRMQPAFALMKTSLLMNVRDFLAAGDRKLELWCQTQRLAVVDFSDRADTFININSNQDLDKLKAQIVL
jgi:molybdopterin-guanine dinucleotide biosynthesis protein A